MINISNFIDVGSVIVKALESTDVVLGLDSDNNVIRVNDLSSGVSGFATSDEINASFSLLAQDLSQLNLDLNDLNAQLADLPSLLPNGSITETMIAPDSISTPLLRANSIVADKIATGAIIANHIGANQIIANHIGANQIVANHISAGAITTSKIAIVNFDNWITNSIFEENGNGSTEGWEIDNLVSPFFLISTSFEKISRYAVKIQSGDSKISWGNLIQVEAGTKIYSSVTVQHNNGNPSSPNLEFIIKFHDINGVSVREAKKVITPGNSFSSWNKFDIAPSINFDTEVRAGEVFASYTLQTTTGISENFYLVTKCIFGKQAKGVLIEDGAITAEKITAGAITADKIQAGAITADSILVDELLAQSILSKNAHISGLLSLGFGGEFHANGLPIQNGALKVINANSTGVGTADSFEALVIDMNGMSLRTLENAGWFGPDIKYQSSISWVGLDSNNEIDNSNLFASIVARNDGSTTQLHIYSDGFINLIGNSRIDTGEVNNSIRYKRKDAAVVSGVLTVKGNFVHITSGINLTNIVIDFDDILIGNDVVPIWISTSASIQVKVTGNILDNGGESTLNVNEVLSLVWYNDIQKAKVVNTGI